MTDGVPPIQALCRELEVPNTFFVNMGRSTNLREWLGKGLKGSRAKLHDMEAINLIQKIGWPRFVLETLLSRPVGRSFIAELQSLQADGHELGLHGGSDHVVWSRRFSTLPEDVISRDVEQTYAYFVSKFGKPAGFTSPGFRSDERVMNLVDRLEFTYNGDTIGGVPELARSGNRQLRHWTIPVTICGPRTIPFLEWHGAQGTARQQILDDLRDRLNSSSPIIMYGHPCYEGVQIELLRAVFETALELGFKFVTHAEIANRLNNGSLVVH
jgi:hypothetical protein